MLDSWIIEEMIRRERERCAPAQIPLYIELDPRMPPAASDEAEESDDDESGHVIEIEI